MDAEHLESGHWLLQGLPGLRAVLRRNLAERWRGIPDHPYEQGFDLRLWPERLEQPLGWKRPRVVFVNSMSDLFHEAVPDAFIESVFDVMARADRHLFQVLTKREDRLRTLAPCLGWPPNVWIGATIENRRFVHRADALREVPAAVRFISAEPLLGPLQSLDLEGIDWVIAGGESGHGARPMRLDWARQLRDQCEREAVSFFLKQLGGFPDKRGKDRALLDGRLWRQMPESARRADATDPRRHWTYAVS